LRSAGSGLSRGGRVSKPEQKNQADEIINHVSPWRGDLCPEYTGICFRHLYLPWHTSQRERRSGHGDGKMGVGVGSGLIIDGFVRSVV